MSAEVGDAVVLLDVKQGSYFDADATGADLWRRLASPIRVQTLIDGLMQEYEVSREVCERDVLAFLQHALESGVIDVTGA